MTEKSANEKEGDNSGFCYQGASFSSASLLANVENKEVILIYSGDFYRGATLQIIKIGPPDEIIWNKSISPVELPPQGKLTNLLREFQTVSNTHLFLKNIKFDQILDQTINQAFTTRQQ